ncbi:MAG: DNA-directed RNA polymerase subunit beta [Candidatus Omnitrophica bacterium]|nr:DNA-directed RNA polymerase subunit beta [Candidatus Omnitrophota bacterium]
MPKRVNFGRLPQVMDLPNLIEIQIKSFADFVQLDRHKNKRENKGLQEVFKSVFPIESSDKSYRLEFVNYSLARPKYEVEECLKLGVSYAAPLKVTLRLRTKGEIKEQEVYLGDLPLMTNTGSFIINGDERVVVNQLHRSPGISFEEDFHPSGKRLISCRLIPYRGAWIEFELDINDILYAVIDRRKKVPATVLLRAFGCEKTEDILARFCGTEKISPINSKVLNKLIGRTIAHPVTDSATNQVLVERFETLDEGLVKKLSQARLEKIYFTRIHVPEILNTLTKDRTQNREQAYIEIYRKIRPADPPTAEASSALIERMFFDPRRYDLGRVGRHILNRKLNLKHGLDKHLLDLETITCAIKALIDLRNGQGKVDDIDHLGNRRIRTVAELLQNQFRIALARLERTVRDRMAIYELENMVPHSLINSKLVSTVIKDFFARSQLSQFMDQTNPLAELTHKRRFSALGPGGLSRERAGFEVRDVHYSHYGRICPIETPEGPNIGLIASMSTYARVNEFGFLETPYRKVINGRVTEKIEYLSADIEDNKIIAQANEPLDSKAHFLNKLVACRYQGDFPKMARNKVEYMDITPCQLVSIAASLIPFLEHDDANRALMGSNMQRQAVPLLDPEPPLIGTGLEARVATDSGAVVVAASAGVVKYVQADKIVIDNTTYNLKKFNRSNANTSINQRPRVSIGQKVKAGQVIADGGATKDGELALGRNILVAFMPWRGYNFEDAILVSEKVVREDAYTSIHIEEFEIEARNTKLGDEEITRDIPNVGEEALKNLDVDGIIRIGAEVSAGDILVGKIAPKSETELSPEEKLLRAIFGEKAGNVRDASLTVPPGIKGIIVDTQVFSRKEARGKSKSEIEQELKQIREIKAYYQSQIREAKKEKEQKVSKLLLGQVVAKSITDSKTDRAIVAQGKPITAKKIDKIKPKDFAKIKLENLAREEKIKKTLEFYNDQINDLSYEQDREIDKIKRGDELPPGVLKKVVVYVASKKKLSVGDKIAGRHGNKGVVAKILPEEDMPFLPDGTPVDLVLNPLGVPSRMNVGQLLETQLGWAAHVLGFKIASPVFDGATEDQIKEQMQKAHLPEDGKITLYDGWTGEAFDQRVTVGYIYMMKLVHLVDDKIHARSIGPYSLVTQQPLGGKAQFGGQRFGEMEVWALEAYGAAYTLQELLTVKSDDVTGRTRVYEAIVKGENAFQPGTPESLNVLIKELQGLGLNVIQERKEKQEAPVSKKKEQPSKDSKTKAKAETEKR